MITGDKSYNSDIVLLNSGANNHLSNNRSLFVSLEEFNYQAKTVSEGDTLDIKGGGDILIKLKSPKRGQNVLTLKVTNMAYALLVRCTILSVSMLAVKG
jgi:hypothetical protein